MLRRPIVIVSMLLLVGCVPTMETYFEPSSEGSLAHRQECHGDIGPPTGINVDVGNGRIELSAKPSTDRPEIVNVFLRFQTVGGWEEAGTFTRRYRYKGNESTLIIRPTDFKAYGESPSTPIRVPEQALYQ